MDFDDLDSLWNNVKKDVKRVIENDVAERIKDIEEEEIDNVVYSWGDPLFYKRRYDNDGIRDRDNMKEVIIHTNDEIILEIHNETRTSKPSSRPLDEIIEEGTGGKRPWEKPRKFTEATQKRVNRENVLENTLKQKIGYLE